MTLGEAFGAYLKAAYGTEEEERTVRIPPPGKAGRGFLLELSDRTVWVPVDALDRPPGRGRWLCVACDVEGKGTPPAECPDCWDKAWYATAAFDGDRRPMKECWIEFCGALFDKRGGDA